MPATKTLAEVVRDHILATLARNNGDRRKTAAELGICLKTLYNKLQRYGPELRDVVADKDLKRQESLKVLEEKLPLDATVHRRTHLKTGNKYSVVGGGLYEPDASPVVLYTPVEPFKHELWVRPLDVFFDGRFVQDKA